MSKSSPSATLITIGDEILIGQIVDTNSAWMAQELNTIGIKVDQILSVSDTEKGILAGLRQAEEVSDIVLITGGLGPTKDDITKRVLTDYFETTLELNQEVLNKIEAFFTKKGREMLEANTKQAELPKSAKIIINECGTASGMWFEKKEKVFISMPGVPYEMKVMMGESIIPNIKEQFSLPRIFHKTIHTYGIGESFIAEKIQDFEDALEPLSIKLAYLPSFSSVRLRLSSYAATEVQKQLVLKKAEELKALTSKYVFGEDEDTLQSVVGKMLLERNQTVSTAESCTGGYISHLITQVSGSSKYYMGSTIAYDYAVKETELNVDPQILIERGAVSQEVVEQMALAATKKYKTDYAISASGIAGPRGGTEDKPVGTVWVAVASPSEVVSKRYQFESSRERNIIKTALAGLNMLRLAIKNDK